VLSVNEDYLNLIAFILTFITVVAFVFLFARLLEGAMKAVSLSLLNKLAGMAFGMLKTALILSSLIYILNRIDNRQNLLSPETRQKSLLFQPIEKIAPVVYPLMQPEKWIHKADSITQPLNNIIDPDIQE
jgi:membrane protein required for colicin V production